jgi:hypothetical protein
MRGTSVAVDGGMHGALVIAVLALPACLFEDTTTQGDDPPAPPGGGNGGGGNPPPPECVNCTPTLPLEFRGAQPVNGSFPPDGGLNNHIAIGGTHEVTLVREVEGTELALPFEADPVLAHLVDVEAIEGAHLTLRGLGTGVTDVRVTDRSGVLLDRAAYAMSALSTAVAIGTEPIASSQFGESALRYVFARGARRVGVAYLNGSSPPNRLVDTSATLTLAGATQTRWDTLDVGTTAVGVHSVAVTAGGIETTVEVEIVEGAESIALLASFSGITCFGAFTGGAFISGGAWTFVVDGEVHVNDPTLEGIFGPNCVLLDGAPHTVTAANSGKSVTVSTP